MIGAVVLFVKVSLIVSSIPEPGVLLLIPIIAARLQLNVVPVVALVAV